MSKSMVRIITLLSIMCFGPIAGAKSPAKYPELNNYVTQLLDQTFDILHDANLTIPEKTERSEKLIAENLDLNWMALYTLGRNRRVLMPMQVQQYVAAYKRYVIETYGSSVKLYDGQDVQVQQVMPLDDTEYSVATLFVNQSSGQEVSVKYRVRLMKEGDYKVFDIVTEGISLVQSQQAEFNSLLSTHGFEKLLEVLHTKADEADAAGKAA